MLRYDIHQFLAFKFSNTRENGQFLNEATNKVLRYMLNLIHSSELNLSEMAWQTLSAMVCSDQRPYLIINDFVRLDGYAYLKGVLDMEIFTNSN